MIVATEPASPQTTSTATGRMKALVYHGPGKRACKKRRVRQSRRRQQYGTGNQ